MISKELLSEVLGYKASYIQMVGTKLCFSCHIKGGSNINIYELAHKCKEWASKKGYVVGTDLDKVNVWSIKERIIINHFEVYFEDYLEFEIKACQWILENKENK